LVFGLQKSSPAAKLGRVEPVAVADREWVA